MAVLQPQLTAPICRETHARRLEPSSLGDPRFRRLIGAEAWDALPRGTRRRFSKRLPAGEAVVYRGRLTELRMNWLGRCLAFLLKPFGAPLPLPRTAGQNLPTIVTVTEGADGVTQHWTRLFTAMRGFPQIIRSAKQFRGPTGLEENIGWGVTMALKVAVVDRVLTFTGVSYAVDLQSLFGRSPTKQTARWRLALPGWLVPGRLTVTHRDLAETDGEGAFEFGLQLLHPWLGELIHQTAIYREVSDG